MPTDIGYTGQRLDTSTGLMYFRARYYASSLGRFASADTIVPGAGNPQAWNRFSYTFNNPLKYTDPSGHCPWCLPVIIIAALLTGCNSQPVDNTYQDRGFLLQGFDAHETLVLGGTIDAYANEVGGANQLQKLMLASNNGASVTIRKDTAAVGADTGNTGIRLGSDTFDLNATRAVNYADWGAPDNDSYAQIRLGHEIGHRLIDVMRPQTDYAEKYKNGVSPNGIPAWTGAVGNPSSDFEQEAVTNMTLHALSAGYTWSTFTGGKDTAGSQRAADIDNWYADLMNALRNKK
jgi:RHS repeat-associated protein